MPNSKQPTAYPLRMPDDLREALAERARANGRSLNAEILVTLEQSLSADTLGQKTADQLIDELARRFGAQINVVLQEPAVYKSVPKKKK